MGTLIINLNDTVVSGDLLVVDLAKMVRTNPPCVQETGMNWANVKITQTICCTSVIIVTICVLGFLLWRLIDHHAQKNVDVRKREWEEEDKNRKQKSDLIDKKLAKLDKDAEKYISTIEEAISQIAI